MTSSRFTPIYCIGDSHVSFFSGENTIQPNWPEESEDVLPFFKTFRLGAVLAYNLGLKRTTMRGHEKLWAILNTAIPNESDVLLCFGEIDCRAHLIKQSHQQNRPIEIVVQDCIDRYLTTIRQVRNAGYPVLVWGPTPSSSSIFGGKYPTYGTSVERNQVTKLFNDYLAQACDTEADIRFASIFDHLITADFETHTDYYMDTIHLSQKAMPLAIEALQTVLPNMPFRSFDFSEKYYKLPHLLQKPQPMSVNQPKVNRVKRFLKRIKSRFINQPKLKRELSAVFEMGFHGDHYLLDLVEQLMAEAMAFIETGTNVGTTAHYIASNYPHVQIYSCEPDTAAFAKAQQTTSGDTTVHLYNQLSPDFLYGLHNEKPTLLNTLNLYWLDAHDYGYQWPLHDEIRHITETLPRAFILVDDVQVPRQEDTFRYCSYDGQECNFDYITNALAPDKTYRIFYPAYTERTSEHHPLIGTMGILHGDVPIDKDAFEHFTVVEVAK